MPFFYHDGCYIYIACHVVPDTNTCISASVVATELSGSDFSDHRYACTFIMLKHIILCDPLFGCFTSHTSAACGDAFFYIRCGSNGFIPTGAAPQPPSIDYAPYGREIPESLPSVVYLATFVPADTAAAGCNKPLEQVYLGNNVILSAITSACPHDIPVFAWSLFDDCQGAESLPCKINSRCHSFLLI